MTSTHAVIVSWQSEAMPVPAYVVYHQEHVPSSSHLPQTAIREVPVADIAHNAVCCGCWEDIHPEQGQQEARAS